LGFFCDNDAVNNRLTRDEARRMAVKFAKLPGLLCPQG